MNAFFKSIEKYDITRMVALFLIVSSLVSSGTAAVFTDSNGAEPPGLAENAPGEDAPTKSNAKVESIMDLGKGILKAISNSNLRERKEQPGVTVLNSRTYDSTGRTSTRSVDIAAAQPLPLGLGDGVAHKRVTVDEGVAHGGKIIYLTLTGEVVAADAASGKGKWLIPREKTTPDWKTVSVVKLESHGTAQTAVELFAPKGFKNWTPTYLYYDIETGKLVNFAAPGSGAQGWGPAPALGNLRLRLKLNEAERKEGQPVLASLEIKNFGDDVESYDWQNFSRIHVLQVTYVSGESDHYIASPVSTMGGPTPLQPGQSKVLWENFDIGSSYLLEQGEYRVQAINSLTRRLKSIPKTNTSAVQKARTMPVSNIEKLVVSKGQQTPIKRFFKSLISVAPDGWEGDLSLIHI